MRVAISKRHMRLNNSLINEINSLVKRFDIKSYSRIENTGNLLSKRDITAEKKKRLLFEQLHKSILKTFSISIYEAAQIAVFFSFQLLCLALTISYLYFLSWNNFLCQTFLQANLFRL